MNTSPRVKKGVQGARQEVVSFGGRFTRSQRGKKGKCSVQARDILKLKRAEPLSFRKVQEALIQLKLQTPHPETGQQSASKQESDSLSYEVGRRRGSKSESEQRKTRSWEKDIGGCPEVYSSA